MNQGDRNMGDGTYLFVALKRQRADGPVLAVDLGYSAAAKSCGVAWSGGGEPQNVHALGPIP